MSRSTFRITNEMPTTNDLRYRPTNRTNETLPIVVQASATKTTNTPIIRNNPRIKRNLRDKRRSTGIRPDDIVVPNLSTEDSDNEDEEEKKNTKPNESSEYNRTIPVVPVNRVQSSFENLPILRTDPSLKPPIFHLRQVEKQTSADDSSTLKYRQLEERILALESTIYDKDNIIHDLQHKLDHITQDLVDAEQQIYKLHQDKLTLIKAFTTIQDTKSSLDLSKRSNFLTRN